MSLRTFLTAGPRRARILFNVWPCLRGTGGRVTHVAADWSALDVRLPLNWRTRNYVGTIFGGSMYAALDPYLMLMLIRRLGDDYVVWDKAATIRFRRPGRTTLTARFRVDDAELAELRTLVELEGGRVDWSRSIDLVDDDGVVHATIEKVLYVATRAADRERRAAHGH